MNIEPIDDHMSRYIRRIQLGLRFLGHGARAHTTCRWTGLTRVSGLFFLARHERQQPVVHEHCESTAERPSENGQELELRPCGRKLEDGGRKDAQHHGQTEQRANQGFKQRQQRKQMQPYNVPSNTRGSSPHGLCASRRH